MARALETLDRGTAAPCDTFAVVQKRRRGKRIYRHKQHKNQADEPSEHDWSEFSIAIREGSIVLDC